MNMAEKLRAETEERAEAWRVARFLGSPEARPQPDLPGNEARGV